MGLRHLGVHEVGVQYRGGSVAMEVSNIGVQVGYMGCRHLEVHAVGVQCWDGGCRHAVGDSVETGIVLDCVEI